MFTDGISTDLDDLKEQAAALKQEATVYAFGIGSEINTDELEVFLYILSCSIFHKSWFLS